MVVVSTTTAPTPDAVAPARRAGGGVPLVLVSIASVQLGAGFARRLFDEVGPAAVVMMRQGGAALVLLAWARPRWRGRSRAEWRMLAAFGITLAAMNLTFYEAVARLPLGIAVTIELLGPLALAVGLARGRRELAFAALAVAGVLLLGEGGGRLDPAGVAFAVAAAAGWATYILLSRAAGRRSAGVDGLAIAMAVAAVAVAPLGLRAGDHLLHPGVLGHGALVALLSGLVPFSLELVALRRVHPQAFGVLMSLSPAAATLAGAVVLGERLRPLQLVAVALVIAASIGAVRRRAPDARG